MPSADYRNQTLGLPSPKMRRDDYDLLMCFRIFKGLTKIRLSDLYKISETSTRGPGTKIVLPRYKTNCWRQAFAVRTAYAFKKLPFHVQNATSIKSFKNKLSSGWFPEFPEQWLILLAQRQVFWEEMQFFCLWIMCFYACVIRFYVIWICGTRKVTLRLHRGFLLIFFFFSVSCSSLSSFLLFSFVLFHRIVTCGMKNIIKIRHNARYLNTTLPCPFLSQRNNVDASPPSSRAEKLLDIEGLNPHRYDAWQYWMLEHFALSTWPHIEMQLFVFHCLVLCSF